MTGTVPGAVVMKIIRHFPSAHSVKQTPSRPHTCTGWGCQTSDLTVCGAEDTVTGLPSWRVRQKRWPVGGGVEKSGKKCNPGQGSAWLRESSAHRKGGRRQITRKGARGKAGCDWDLGRPSRQGGQGWLHPAGAVSWTMAWAGGLKGPSCRRGGWTSRAGRAVRNLKKRTVQKKH